VGCYKTPKHTVPASLVGAGWKKSGLNLKIGTKSEVSVSWTPTKGSVKCFDHHCEGKVFINIFLCRKFVPNVFG